MRRGILVHEWLAKTGGSENVFDAMVDAFPEEDLLCLWTDVKDRYPGRELRETWIARTPLRKSKIAALAFMLPTWRNQTQGEHDWALVSSHLFAHHVRLSKAPTGTRKYLYVHSPARYIWTPELDTRGAGLAKRVIALPLRLLDRRRAQEAHSIAANSLYVKDRIERYWHREATVIYPPVDVERIQSIENWEELLSATEKEFLDTLPTTFLLGASRFVPYKRLDLAIAAGAASGVAVVLAGAGPQEQELRTLAQESGCQVIFAISPSNELLYALYQRTLAFVFLAIEDFGIMPVEAMAAGAPVIGLRTGGTAETVVDGLTGVLVGDPTGDELRKAVGKVEILDPADCRARAREFSKGRFSREILQWVELNNKTTIELDGEKR